MLIDNFGIIDIHRHCIVRWPRRDFRVSEIPSFRDSEFPSFRDSEFPSFRVSEIGRFSAGFGVLEIVTF
jgi:hypothetical protein